MHFKNKYKNHFITQNLAFKMNISIVITQEEHYKYSHEICDAIELSALLRGTGIAKRTPEYIQKKMESKDAIIALDNGKFTGF